MSASVRISSHGKTTECNRTQVSRDSILSEVFCATTNAHRPAKKNKNAKNVGTMRPNTNNSQNNNTQSSCDNDAFDSILSATFTT